MTYRQQARKSLYWVAMAQVASKALGFLRSLLLYNWLARSLLGLVGMADLVLNALLLFQELGFSSALIYRKDRTDEAAGVTFWIVMGTSLVLYLIVVLGAYPLVALITSDPGTIGTVVGILRVLALTIPLSGLSLVQLVLMTKELDFRRRVIPEVLSAAVNLTVVILLASRGRGVWSIVYGRLAECITLGILVWSISRWRPRLRFNRAVAWEMFNYARHIVGSQVLIFFITNIDNAFISRFLGTYALGGYDAAYTLANRPATEITRLFGQVMFPAFSKVRDDVVELRAFFLRTTRYIAYISIPLSVCIAVFADKFLTFAYGSKFLDIIWPLRILTIYGLLRSVAANMGGILKAGGKPNWLFNIAAARLAVMAALLYPATVRYGILGVSVLSAAVSIVDFAVSTWLVNRIVQARMLDYVSMLLPPFLIAVAAGAAANALYPHLAFLKGFIALPLGGGIMLGLYGVVLWLVAPEARQLVEGLYNDIKQRGRLMLRPRGELG